MVFPLAVCPENVLIYKDFRAFGEPPEKLESLYLYKYTYVGSVGGSKSLTTALRDS